MQRLPEAQGAVAGGEFRIQLQAVLVAQAKQQFAPALRALAKAVLDREQFLATAGVGADQHQHALPLVLQAWGEVDAIGPAIDVAPCREIALLPVLMLLLPALSQTAHGRR
jgi:hypothetical protein